MTAGDSAAAARAVQHAGGQVSSDLWLIDAVAATIPAGRLQALATTPGLRSIVHNKGVETADKPIEPKAEPIAIEGSDPAAWDGWVTDYRFPVPWDGTPDVQPTSNWQVYDFAYPVNVDLGTDTLYDVLGVGTTVAIVDSGVYFDEQVRAELGQNVAKLFQGQADFVDPVCDEYVGRNKKLVVAGTQFDDHCFTGVDHSQDPYGHGTHVAGIIWSQISDHGPA